jgi:hypothetical protein
LQLDNTLITDKGLEKLQSLQQLQSINLVGTNITVEGLKALKNLTQLQSIYVYKTKIKKEDFAQLQKDFPKVLLDSGGYNVPLFPDDTVV